MKSVWKRGLLKAGVFVLIFIASIIIISKIMNKGNTGMTREVTGTTYPIVHVLLDSKECNTMFGYAQAMQPDSIKDSITPIDNTRSVAILVDTFGRTIHGVTLEVRSVDGQRLVESTPIYNYVQTDDTLKAEFSVKDLIRENTQYTLVILLELEDQETIRYYTRIIQNEKLHLEEQLSFAADFHNATFEKEALAIITDHVESNSGGNNTDYASVNIHSKVDQITWGDLKIESKTEPVYTIQEIGTETASILLTYMVAIENDGVLYDYKVEEYFRTRYTANRIYLLDYERSMDQLLEPDKIPINQDTLMLGITKGEVSLEENEAGTILAFAKQNVLYCFHIADNKLSTVYNPYATTGIDYRTVFAKQKTKILSISETGNITYLVYGHLSQGDREGYVGVQVFVYDATTNTIEEKAFIPYERSEQVLMAEVDTLAYVNVNNALFLTLGNNLYRVDLDEATYRVEVENMSDGSYQYSDDLSMIVYKSDLEEDNTYAGKELTVYNLSTEQKTTISAQADSYITPLGFMGTDLIFGQARKSQITKDNVGNMVFPMYNITIQDASGKQLKQYAQDGIYVLGITIEDNLIGLKRAAYSDTTQELVQISDDQIICSERNESGKNTVTTVNSKNFKKISQITLHKSVTKNKTLILTPKEVVAEGSVEVNLENSEKTDNRYYVYGKEGIEAIYTDVSKAVQKAVGDSAVVCDDTGAYVWQSGNRLLSNQIMAIETAGVTAEKGSLAVCIESILSFNGITRNAQAYLDEGQSVSAILEASLPNATVMDLTGCSLNAVLYYVSNEYPVLAVLEDKSAVLIVGYNQQNVVLMNPTTGKTYKRGMNDSAEWFSQNGNVFITYRNRG